MITLYLGILGPEHSPVITTGGQIIIAMIAVLGTVLVARIEKGNKQAARAAEAAATAAANAAPVANGFSAHVRAALERIEARQLHIEEELQGLRGDDRRLWDAVSRRLGESPTERPRDAQRGI